MLSGLSGLVPQSNMLHIEVFSYKVSEYDQNVEGKFKILNVTVIDLCIKWWVLVIYNAVLSFNRET